MTEIQPYIQNGNAYEFQTSKSACLSITRHRKVAEKKTEIGRKVFRATEGQKIKGQGHLTALVIITCRELDIAAIALDAAQLVMPPPNRRDIKR